jgi:RHS repeat-associated protein
MDALTTASPETRLAFTGHERDTALALDSMKARYSSPSLGRFHSVDPVEEKPAAPQSWNRFAYTRNDPQGTQDDPTVRYPHKPEDRHPPELDPDSQSQDLGFTILVDHSSATITVIKPDGSIRMHPAGVADLDLNPDGAGPFQGTVTRTGFGATGPRDPSGRSWSTRPGSEKTLRNPYGPAYLETEGTNKQWIHGTPGPMDGSIEYIGGDSPEGRQFTHGCARLLSTDIMILKKEVGLYMKQGGTVVVRFKP